MVQRSQPNLDVPSLEYLVRCTYRDWVPCFFEGLTFCEYLARNLVHLKAACEMAVRLSFVGPRTQYSDWSKVSMINDFSSHENRKRKTVAFEGRSFSPAPCQFRNASGRSKKKKKKNAAISNL